MRVDFIRVWMCPPPLRLGHNKAEQSHNRAQLWEETKSHLHHPSGREQDHQRVLIIHTHCTATNLPPISSHTHHLVKEALIRGQLFCSSITAGAKVTHKECLVACAYSHYSLVVAAVITSLCPSIPMFTHRASETERRRTRIIKCPTSSGHKEPRLRHISQAYPLCCGMICSTCDFLQ